MAILEAPQNERERTKREAIDAALLRACKLAEANNLEVLRLRAHLLGAPSEEQRPERPSRPGWVGEIQDALETMNDHLEGTASALQDISKQLATPVPAAIVPRRSTTLREDR